MNGAVYHASCAHPLHPHHQLSWMHWGYKWYIPLTLPPLSRCRCRPTPPLPCRFANLTWDNPGFFLTNGYEACINRSRQARVLLMLLCVSMTVGECGSLLQQHG